MSKNDLEIAREYLLPGPNSFWRWGDKGDAIEWTQGGTIAFRPELVFVLRHLVPVGLPPRDCVLLLLAATRDNWSAAPHDAIFNSIPCEVAGEMLDLQQSSALRERLFENGRGLSKLVQLPTALRSSLEAKATLIEVVLEEFRAVTTPSEANIVLDYLENGMGEILAWYDSSVEARIESTLSRERLETLCEGLERATPETLRNRRQTSLDQLPQAIDSELPQSQQARALLTSLLDDDQLQGLAKLARDLMAAVSLPRALADQEEMQIGGVSDITNRGPLDRLLLTELVHDDLTLAVRVSVNEALYLRRESPPRTPQKERIVLLDSGIRSWGVPRVFATAVALALTATTGSNTQISVFRAADEKVKPVNLLTREGLVEHLQQLDATAHPGKALPAFLEAFQTLDSAAEPVIVVAEEVLSDPEFQQALAAAAFPSVHLASVSRSGRFCLIEKNLRGSKRVREAELNVEQLFADRPATATPLIDRSLANDLPVIFKQRPFPLRISHQVEYKQTISLAEHGFLTISNHGCLHHWDQKSTFGSRILHDQLPAGGLTWCKYDASEKMAYGVITKIDRRELAFLQVDVTNSVAKTSFVTPRSKGNVIALRDGVLLVLSPNQSHLEAISLQTAESLDVLRLPTEIAWTHDRFFRGRHVQDPWHAASFDGSRLQLDSVVHSDDAKKYEFVHFGEYHGLNAPYGVTRDGMIYYSDTREVWPIWREDRLIQDSPRVSQDGRRLLLYPQLAKNSPELPCCLVDLQSRTPAMIQSPKPEKIFPTLHPEAKRFLTSHSMRNHFTHVAVSRRDDLDCLVLVTRRKGLLALKNLAEGRPRLYREKYSENVTLGKTFKMVKAPRFQFSLGCATWEDGSQAFLDSRGILHLRSSDPNLPELSITLSDWEATGWSSDGRHWGASWQTGRPTSSDSEGKPLENLVRRFIRNLR
ncbi:hypothetical protein LOC68_02230 [Blastopirellula sp. JC732]|uniref:Uncharacterized protein n=1 Tax=Blastopirellula sediminis TaxID=2894196 RepID=A0A9X1MJ35_9BACT|nr:hypothetical protein [Blastopirellula sediminis]MCC9607992.1 hypothetical protein [Blastopirellula sediminis]MCC9627215.1 hypothetical protein [Blastopirellula sediminis]